MGPKINLSSFASKIEGSLCDQSLKMEYTTLSLLDCNKVFGFSYNRNKGGRTE